MASADSKGKISLGGAIEADNCSAEFETIYQVLNKCNPDAAHSLVENLAECNSRWGEVDENARQPGVVNCVRKIHGNKKLRANFKECADKEQSKMEGG